LIKQSLEEWLKEAEERFVQPGQDDKGAIAFICPNCGHIQTLKDFKERGLDLNLAYQECIGRHDKSIGCDWAAYGFLKTMGHGRIVVHENGEMEVFDFAPAPTKEVAS
jgi:hypothetical protein